ncbi:MAG TPA: hypothetical protein VIK14_05715 [Ignavibacteria bacterium]
MQKINLLIFSVLLFALNGNLTAQCVQTDKRFYMGIGTGISTYVGGEFGNRFQIRVSGSNYNNYDYNNNYYYNRYNYNDNYYDNSSFYPLQADFTLGIKTSEMMSVEINAGIIWHNNGNPNPVYETGTYGNYDYTDRYDYSNVLAIPIKASVKIYPLWAIKAPLYLKAGYGVQYTHEELSRVREFYDPNSYYGYYDNVYSYPIAEYSDSRWLHGFSVGIGFSYRVYEQFSGDVEVTYSNFFSELKEGSPLAMNQTKNIGNISLGTKVYFGF